MLGGILLPRQSIYLPGTRKLRDAMRCMWGPLAGGMAPLTLRYGAATSTWWTAGGATGVVAAYAAKGASSQAASYVNLAQPGTYDLTLGVAPTWDTATGWTFNGSSQWLDTGYTVQNVQARSMVVKFSGVSGTSWGAFGGMMRTDGAYGYGIIPHTPGNFAQYNNGGALNVAWQASGVHAIAENTAYFNGLSQGVIAWVAFVPYSTFYLGGWKYSGGVIYRACIITALALYSGTLTQPQVAAIGAAMP